MSDAPEVPLVQLLPSFPGVVGVRGLELPASNPARADAGMSLLANSNDHANTNTGEDRTPPATSPAPSLPPPPPPPPLLPHLDDDETTSSCLFQFQAESGSSGCVGTADSLSTFSGGEGADTPPNRLAFRAPWATPPKAPRESNKVGGILSPPYIAAPRNGTGSSAHAATTPESDFALHDLGESFPLSPPTRWETAR